MPFLNPEGVPPLVASMMVRVERYLPYPGEVIVRQGSRVEPEDIVARTWQPLPPHLIDVAQQLSIPPRQIPKFVRRDVGALVRSGDILARSRNPLGARCRAPVDGLITAIDQTTGYLTLAPNPVEYTLSAALRGIVMEIMPTRGVVIETPATQIYGAFGVGRERSGVLRLLALDPREIVRPEQIDARSAYAILICGASISAATLRRAVAEQVRGIIVGGIEEQELRSFLGWQSPADWAYELNLRPTDHAHQRTNTPLTLIVTEGFGVRSMNQALFDLLSSQDRQEVLIDGQTSLGQPLRRPRLIIPQSPGSSKQIEPPRPPLRVGATVRLLDDSHLGQSGTVRSLPEHPRRLSSGLRTAAVEVVLQDSSALWLPHSCVEVLR